MANGWAGSKGVGSLGQDYGLGSARRRPCASVHKGGTAIRPERIASRTRFHPARSENQSQRSASLRFMKSTAPSKWL